MICCSIMVEDVAPGSGIQVSVNTVWPKIGDVVAPPRGAVSADHESDDAELVTEHDDTFATFQNAYDCFPEETRYGRICRCPERGFPL
jgi:hypothetical protein